MLTDFHSYRSAIHCYSNSKVTSVLIWRLKQCIPQKHSIRQSLLTISLSKLLKDRPQNLHQNCPVLIGRVSWIGFNCFISYTTADTCSFLYWAKVNNECFSLVSSCVDVIHSNGKGSLCKGDTRSICDHQVVAKVCQTIKQPVKSKQREEATQFTWEKNTFVN